MQSSFRNLINGLCSALGGQQHLEAEHLALQSGDEVDGDSAYFGKYPSVLDCIATLSSPSRWLFPEGNSVEAADARCTLRREDDVAGGQCTSRCTECWKSERPAPPASASFMKKVTPIAAVSLLWLLPAHGCWNILQLARQRGRSRCTAGSTTNPE